MKDTGWTDR